MRPRTLDELTDNARLTAESFHGRAEGACSPTEIVPDWSVLMVQFQNLDPFQHRAWPYLNVDETGIDDPDWNDAAAEVIRGLDAAIGLLCELADRRGRRHHGRQRPRFRPLPGPGRRQPDLVDAGCRPAAGAGWPTPAPDAQGRDRLRLWDAKRGDPTARSASFDQSVSAQFPFDWKRTLAFAPHQDTAAMVYVNSAARQGLTRDSAPLLTPRQIDEARHTAAPALAEARHPETGRPLFPQIIATAEAYRLDPAREGYPDLIALPDEPYWVRTKLSGDGRGSSPTPTCPAPTGLRGSSRWRARTAAGPLSPGEAHRRHAHHPQPARPAHPRPHRRPADRRNGPRSRGQ